MKTIFEKILDKEINTNFLYEDEFCAAFNDIAPVAPIHCLIIPKIKIINLKESVSEYVETMGHLMAAVPEVAKIVCPNNDFRLVINNGETAGQTVFYLHIHLLSGRKFNWPPG